MPKQPVNELMNQATALLGANEQGDDSKRSVPYTGDAPSDAEAAKKERVVCFEPAGLGLLPVRYALVPDQSVFDSISLTDDLQHPVTQIPQQHHRYVLRQLRAGYLYLYFPDAEENEQHWEILQVDDQAQLRWLDAQKPLLQQPPPKGDAHPFHRLNRSSCNEAWVAYSEHPWSTETLTHMAQDTQKRQQRMTPLPLAQLRNAPDSANTQALTLDNLKKVLEYSGDMDLYTQFHPDLLQQTTYSEEERERIAALKAEHQDDPELQKAFDHFLTQMEQSKSKLSLEKGGFDPQVLQQCVSSSAFAMNNDDDCLALIDQINQSKQGKAPQPILLALPDVTGMVRDLGDYGLMPQIWQTTYFQDNELELDALGYIEQLKTAHKKLDKEVTTRLQDDSRLNAAYNRLEQLQQQKQPTRQTQRHRVYQHRFIKRRKQELLQELISDYGLRMELSEAPNPLPSHQVIYKKDAVYREAYDRQKITKHKLASFERSWQRQGNDLKALAGNGYYDGLHESINKTQAIMDERKQHMQEQTTEQTILWTNKRLKAVIDDYAPIPDDQGPLEQDYQQALANDAFYRETQQRRQSTQKKLDHLIKNYELKERSPSDYESEYAYKDLMDKLADIDQEIADYQYKHKNKAYARQQSKPWRSYQKQLDQSNIEHWQQRRHALGEAVHLLHGDRINDLITILQHPLWVATLEEYSYDHLSDAFAFQDLAAEVVRLLNAHPIGVALIEQWIHDAQVKQSNPIWWALAAGSKEMHQEVSTFTTLLERSKYEPVTVDNFSHVVMVHGVPTLQKIVKAYITLDAGIREATLAADQPDIVKSTGLFKLFSLLGGRFISSFALTSADSLGQAMIYLFTQARLGYHKVTAHALLMKYRLQEHTELLAGDRLKAQWIKGKDAKTTSDGTRTKAQRAAWIQQRVAHRKETLKKHGFQFKSSHEFFAETTTARLDQLKVMHPKIFRHIYQQQQQFIKQRPWSFAQIIEYSAPSDPEFLRASSNVNSSGAKVDDGIKRSKLGMHSGHAFNILLVGMHIMVIKSLLYQLEQQPTNTALYFSLSQAMIGLSSTMIGLTIDTPFLSERALQGLLRSNFILSIILGILTLVGDGYNILTSLTSGNYGQAAWNTAKLLLNATGSVAGVLGAYGKINQLWNQRMAIRYGPALLRILPPKIGPLLLSRGFASVMGFMSGFIAIGITVVEVLFILIRDDALDDWLQASPFAWRQVRAFSNASEQTKAYEEMLVSMYGSQA